MGVPQGSSATPGLRRSAVGSPELSGAPNIQIRSTKCLSTIEGLVTYQQYGLCLLFIQNGSHNNMNKEVNIYHPGL